MLRFSLHCFKYSRFLHDILITSVKKLFVDIGVIAASICFAVYLVQSGTLHNLFALIGNNVLLASFISGALFTSFFTTPLSIAMFSELAGDGNIVVIAAVGGLGAMWGDFILFWFVRHYIARDAGVLMKGPRWKRVLRVLRSRRFRRILPVIGAIIIASPFPDEIGLALIGVSTLSPRSFFLLSYSMNTLGIFATLFVATLL